jgi:membrane-associated phospholipid phosphatase
MDRIRSVIGACLTITALAASVGTEISARNHVAAYREQLQDAARRQHTPVYDRRVGYEQATLATRWSFPDGHATLGAGFALFGIMLVAAPLASRGR